jgi:hypothetical protein
MASDWGSSLIDCHQTLGVIAGLLSGFFAVLGCIIALSDIGRHVEKVLLYITGFDWDDDQDVDGNVYHIARPHDH